MKSVVYESVSDSNTQHAEKKEEIDKVDTLLFQQAFELICTTHKDYTAILDSTKSILFDKNEVTYSELNQKCNQIASYLMGMRTQSGSKLTKIGILLESSIDAVACIIAVLKTPIAYVPMSPSGGDSESRIVRYCELADPEVLITSKKHQHLISQLSASDRKILDLGELRNSITSYPTQIPNYSVSYNDIAYVIFSSGSTGDPKGIRIKHYGLVNFMEEICSYLATKNSDVIAQFTTLNFDASLCEIFMAVGRGAKLVIVPIEIRSDYDKLYDYYNTYKITQAIFTPSLLQELKVSPQNFQTINRIISTGEAIIETLVNDWYKRSNPEFKLINGYGPSECTIGVCLSECSIGGKIDFGKPILHHRLFLFPIIDADTEIQNFTFTEVPDGEEGEIYLSGIGLADSYLDDKLTKERFIKIQDPDPDKKEKTILVYRTRDKAKRNDKTITLTGRIDRQIKIHGKLVCPQEIEAALIKHGQIEEAYVTPTQINTRWTIGATLILKKGQNIHNNLALVYELFHDYLSKLPQSMGVSRWNIFSERPITKDRFKLDKEIVEKFDDKSELLLGFRRVYDNEKIECPFEDNVRNIWSEILGIASEKLNHYDNFIYLGGDSIDIARLVSNVCKLPKLEKLGLSVVNFKQSPTLGYILRKIQKYLVKKNTLDKAQPASDNSKSPLWLIPSLTGDADLDYSSFRSCWPTLEGRELIFLNAKGLKSPTLMGESVQEMADDIVHEILERQPQGPYLILSWSAGVTIAYEVAQQLKQDGRQVAVIAIDGVASHYYQSLSKLEHAKLILKMLEWLCPLINCAVPEISLEDICRLPSLFQYDLIVEKIYANIKEEGKNKILTIRKVLSSLLSYEIDPNDFTMILYVAGKEKQYLDKDSRMYWPHYVNLKVDTKFLEDQNHFQPFLGTEPFLSRFAEEIATVCNKLEAELHLDKLAPSLKRKYCTSKRLTLIFRAFEGHLNKKATSIYTDYINLALVEETAQRAEEGRLIRHGLQEHDLLSSFEEIYSDSRRKIIQVNELFERENFKKSRKLLIVGRAGIGKSTFCQSVISRWAKDALWHRRFKFVFLIKLRNLTDDFYTVETKIEEIIKKECLYGDSVNATIGDLSSWRKLVGKKILFILDGYDEFSSTNCRRAIDDLLDDENSYVIMTSRPFCISNAKFDSTLELIGFTLDNVKMYIYKYFSEDGRKAESLYNYIIKNVLIRGLSHIPLMLQLICLIWDENLISNNDISLTLTMLYSTLVNRIFQRKQFRGGYGFDPNNYKSVTTFPTQQFYEKLAYQTLCADKVLLNSNDIRLASEIDEKFQQIESFFRNIDSSDWLVPMIRMVDRKSERCQYYFIHRTFQEYFAARHWISMFKEGNNQAKNDLYKYKNESRFTLMWWFCAGLLEKDVENRIKFFEQLRGSPKDVGNSYHLTLTLRCLDEVRLHDYQSVEYADIDPKEFSETERKEGGRVRVIGQAVSMSPGLASLGYFENYFLKKLSGFKKAKVIDDIINYKISGQKIIEQLDLIANDKYEDPRIKIMAIKALCYLSKNSQIGFSYYNMLIQYLSDINYHVEVMDTIEWLLKNLNVDDLTLLPHLFEKLVFLYDILNDSDHLTKMFITIENILNRPKMEGIFAIPSTQYDKLLMKILFFLNQQGGKGSIYFLLYSISGKVTSSGRKAMALYLINKLDEGYFRLDDFINLELATPGQILKSCIAQMPDEDLAKLIDEFYLSGCTMNSLLKIIDIVSRITDEKKRRYHQYYISINNIFNEASTTYRNKFYIAINLRLNYLPQELYFQTKSFLCKALLESSLKNAMISDTQLSEKEESNSTTNNTDADHIDINELWVAAQSLSDICDRLEKSERDVVFKTLKHQLKAGDIDDKIDSIIRFCLLPEEYTDLKPMAVISTLLDSLSCIRSKKRVITVEKLCKIALSEDDILYIIEQLTIKGLKFDEPILKKLFILLRIYSLFIPGRPDVFYGEYKSLVYAMDYIFERYQDNYASISQILADLIPENPVIGDIYIRNVINFMAKEYKSLFPIGRVTNKIMCAFVDKLIYIIKNIKFENSQYAAVLLSNIIYLLNNGQYETLINNCIQFLQNTNIDTIDNEQIYQCLLIATRLDNLRASSLTPLLSFLNEPNVFLDNKINRKILCRIILGLAYSGKIRLYSYENHAYVHYNNNSYHIPAIDEIAIELNIPAGELKCSTDSKHETEDFATTNQHHH